MKYYEFKKEDAYEFGRFIGIKTKEGGGQLHFEHCPYCRSSKDKGTFAIDLKTGKFKCLRASCGVTGNMITISKDFDFSLGIDVDEYYKPKKRFRTLPTPTEKIVPKEPALVYLETRGISKETVEVFQLTVQNNHENVLVFPFFDEKGILQFVKYRKTDFDKNKDKCKEWCEKNTKPILFGMKQIEDRHKDGLEYTSLVISEGQMDSLSIYEAFNGNIDVVSVPIGCNGFTFFPYCWDWINKFQEIIIFGDKNKDNVTLFDEFSKRLSIPVKHVRICDYLDCKDANELLLKYGKEQVQKCVNEAIMPPINKVIKLSDVKSVDIYKLPKQSTGIKSIDKILCGGLPYGIVTLVAGKRGGGKSTLASEFLANSLKNGIPSFAYSGELPNYLFKHWLDFQIAGRQNIITNTNDFGEVSRFITNSNQAQIDNWYNDICYLYDNSYVDADNEEGDLLAIVERVVQQYGVRFVLIDNLMTAMYLEHDKSSDKFERQGSFVRKLTILALKYDIIIVLVVHKRKSSFGEDENDEVSGSADITNLAGITINYDRVPNKEIEKGYATENDRVISITKNRIFGKTDYKGFYAHYDEVSKRIYATGDNIDTDYGWKQREFDDTEQEETPFD